MDFAVRTHVQIDRNSTVEIWSELPRWPNPTPMPVRSSRTFYLTISHGRASSWIFFIYSHTPSSQLADAVQLLISGGGFLAPEPSASLFPPTTSNKTGSLH
ncbi:hypothetical protein PISMIDRAFT_452932 [Pisolithus microcarpus 441]|uniref:Unplaced genomic scaffold scaffold_404, whole genome shotgun sequence n=1 Tax=Pisolithus microcarpus 441 TaxID=765257 RepID=A0A0C9YWW4_9AGAM|nr:hypothetical protein PISMIDRAFT_452932 [Pisolithus microcarpus 441]